MRAPASHLTRARTRVPRCAALAVAVGALASACGARSGDLVDPALDLTHAGPCPYTTAAAWDDFLARAASAYPWTATCDDGVCTEPYASVDQGVASVFRACAGLLRDNPGIAACTDPLRRFTTSWMQQHDATTYGFTSDNEAIFAAETAPGTPEGMMIPPDALLAAMPSLDAVEAAAASRGWPYVVQDSCLGGVRLFVLAPDPAKRFDAWTLMNLRADSPAELHERVSFLAVQRATGDGTPLPAVRVHFRDYLVAPSAGGGYTLTSDDGDNAKCYSCHPSGPRQLLAMRTASLDAKPVSGEPGYGGGAGAPPDFAFQRLSALNAHMAGYGLPDWDGTIVVADHGPPLGAAQGCTACHDGHTRGILTVSTSVAQVAHKVATELAMPPTSGLEQLVERDALADPPLSPAEKAALDQARSGHAALLADFEASRGPALEAWLLATPCSR